MNPAFTTAERVEIEDNAAALGISASEFMRRRALSYRMPPLTAEQRETARLATALIRIGNNLNQLTHHANAGHVQPAAVEYTLARINAFLDGIYDPGPDGVRA